MECFGRCYSHTVNWPMLLPWWQMEWPLVGMYQCSQGRCYHLVGRCYGQGSDAFNMKVSELCIMASFDNQYNIRILIFVRMEIHVGTIR